MKNEQEKSDLFMVAPESIGEMIAHNVAAIGELTERIKALDTSISRLAAERRTRVAGSLWQSQRPSHKPR